MMIRACLILLSTAAIAECQAIQPRSDAISPAEPNLPLAEGKIRAQLRRLTGFIERRQWRDAISLCRILNDHSADALIESKTDDSFERIIPLHDQIAIQLVRIARQADATVEEFRNRSDLQARYLLESAMVKQDPSLLRRVIDEFPISHAARRAMNVLAERELSNRNFNSARRFWGMARYGLDLSKACHSKSLLGAWKLDAVHSKHSVGPIGDTDWRNASDSPFSHADMDARLVLVSLLQGDRRRAEHELALFRQMHDGATGMLGGQEVVLAEELDRLIGMGSGYRSNEPVSVHSDATAQEFAPTLRPQWRFALPVRVERNSRSEQPNIHPRIAMGLVVFSTGRSLHALNATDGKPVGWSADDFGTVYPKNANLSKPGEQVSSNFFSLSADASTLFAILKTDEGESLVQVDLAQDGEHVVSSILPDTNAWSFAGCPIADEQRIYAIMWRVSRNAEMYLACFESGDLIWRRKICDVERSAVQGVDAGTPALLTLSEDELFLNSNLGFVSAISKLDGEPRWICRYPRSRFTASNLLDRPWYRRRTRNPCLVKQDILYALPSDFDGMFALDVLSGKLLWKTTFPEGRFDPSHVLGVFDDVVMVGGRRLWGLDRYSGRLSKKIRENPFPRDLFNEMRGVGFGICVQKQIVWPTKGIRDRLLFFDAGTGRMNRQPWEIGGVDVSSGNLFVNQDWLLITGKDEIVAFRNRSKRSSKYSVDVGE